MPTKVKYKDAQSACMQEEGTLAPMATESDQQAFIVYLAEQDDGAAYWLPYTRNTKSRLLPITTSEPENYWWMDPASDEQTLVDNNTLCMVVDTNTIDFNNRRQASCDDLYKPVCRKELGICPSGYTKYNDFCFRFEIERRTTWREARSFCNIRNTKLLRIQSNDTQIFIERNIQKNSTVWLGFSGTRKDSWRWFDEGDDSTLAFGAFETNKTASLARNIEMCGVLTGSGKWESQDCGSSNAGTVCIGHFVSRPLGSPCPVEEQNCLEGPLPEPPHTLTPTFKCDISNSYDLSQQNGLCYRQIPMLVDWYKARTLCANDNAILVDAVTNETMTMLATTYGTTSDKESERWIWTGLNDREKEGHYVWQRGTSQTTKGYWMHGSPNNFEVGTVYSENCVVMATASHDAYLSGDNRSLIIEWDDIPCGFKRRAVCQKGPEYNIALGKMIAVSSGDQGYQLIDDCVDRDISKGCCGIITGSYPWWQLDLGIPFTISSIVIHRRFKEGCAVCPTEMRDFRLFISNVTGSKNDTDLVYTETSDRPQTIITVLLDTPITGRYVRIDIPKQDVSFALCEVQVFEYNGWTGKKLTPENSNCITDSTKWLGLVNHTETGLECQRWVLDIPHNHGYHDDTFAGGQNQHEAENYCRDPRGEGQPWCYTTNPNVRWQFCSIPHCTVVTNQGHKDKSATNSSICKNGWDEDPNTGACQRSGYEQLTFADAVNVCQNEGASVFVPTMESGIGVFNESEIQWLGIIYDMNTTQWKQLSGLDVPMFILDALASATAKKMTGPSCALISVKTEAMHTADCLERHNFTCKTAERFLIVKHGSAGGEYVTAPFLSKYHNAYKFEFRGESAALLRLTGKNDIVHYEIKLGGKYSTQCTIKDVETTEVLYKTRLDVVTSATTNPVQTSNRLRGFVVYISSVSDSTMDSDIVYRNTDSSVPYITRIPVDGKRGRYVKISLKDKREFLTLCEVEVMLDQDSSNCYTGWHDYPDTKKCYRIIDQPMRSQQGAEICSQLDATMSLPTSLEEELFLYSLLIGLRKPHNTSMWLPVMRNGNKMKIMADESHLRYNRFKNDESSFSNATLCAGIGQSTGGSWDWFPCSDKRTVICQLKEFTSTTSVTYSTSTATTEDRKSPYNWVMQNKYWSTSNNILGSLKNSQVDASPGEESGLTQGEIIGVVIGVIVGVVSLGVCVFFVRKFIVASNIYQMKQGSFVGFDNAMFNKGTEDSVIIQ
ncbi:PLMN-like protein [Mya arenaria]|uniref:PLMN-like protein n=1 Tax=Mya arenaria TaxID=6604 RepID=A0ABY7E7J1_MYAAR|nr:PLMN-like protein [Mya arenaria]